MNLLEARRQSHQTRNAITYDIRFSDDGVVVEPDNTFANMMGGMTAPEQTGDDLFGFTGSDVVDTAKAAGRAVAGGVQDAVTGVVGLADDIGTAIDDKIGGLGYITLGPDGLEYTRKKVEGAPRLDELFDAGLQELGVKVPEGDSPVETMARSLVQFGAGMVAAPIRGAGYVNTMLRGGFADALFDPEEGNLSTLLKEFGLDGAVLDFLDSKVDNEASAEERLTARMKQSLEGAGIALPIDLIVNGFKTVRSDEGAVEIIRNKLSNARETITQPGEMPTVGSNLGNIADFKAPTEKEPGIIAFSGSGRDFDEFKLEKVGTGTGEAAFGNGLYFSDVEEIAQFYRKMLDTDGSIRGQKIKYKGQKIDDLGDTAAAEAAPPSYFAISDMAREMSKGSTALEAKEFLLNKIDEDLAKYSKGGEKSELGSTVLSNGQTVDEFLTDELKLKKQALLKIEPNEIEVEKGKVYQVELDVTPDKLLDYEKPIGEQNEFVKERLKKLVETELNESDAANLGFEPSQLNQAKEEMLKGDMSVVYFLNNWAVFRGKDNAAEELLNKYGVKGIKYKADRGGINRNKISPDAKNYVIFDDKIINIMKKYGIVGPVAVTAKSVASNNDEQEGI